MWTEFIDALARNAATVLTIAGVIGAGAGGWLFWRARQRRVDGLRAKLRGDMEISAGMREKLQQMLNANTFEVGAVGAVTFVDVAWQYSMADPAIWDHLEGRVTEAMQHMDVLQDALGEKAVPIFDHVMGFLRSQEALQVFGDLADNLPAVGGEAGAVVLEAKGESLVGSLAKKSAATAIEESGSPLATHIPLVTIGFASYRAWRRSQKGTGLRRNAEFVAIEVTTRASGGIVGGKVGGVVGTVVVPGVGTVIGTVAGAVAGTIGGAVLGENVKRRHVESASRELEDSLEALGQQYLDDQQHYEQIKGVFVEQERQYLTNLEETERKLRRHAMPWRVAWPDEKLILLEETVTLAEQRLGSLRQGTVEAVDKLDFMRQMGQYHDMGLMLYSNPALCEQANVNGRLEQVESANERLREELAQLGR